MRRRMMIGLVAAALAVPGSATARDMPETIFVTRHYDTPAGVRDPDLTPTGAKRAKALAKRLGGRRLTAIYVTHFKRTRQTIAPLAAAQGLTPIVYGPAPTPEFLAMLKRRRGPVLVVGHSDTVPDIVAGLGGQRPGEIAHPDFGDLWDVTGGRATVTRIEP